MQSDDLVIGGMGGVNGFAQPYYKAVNATSRSTVNPANPCAEKPCGNGNPNHRLFNGSGDFGFDMSSRFTEKQFRCLRCLGYEFVIIRAYRSSGEITFVQHHHLSLHLLSRITSV